MATSSTVSAGDTILATQYNNLRTDVLSTHIHDSTDGATVDYTDLTNFDTIALVKAADEIVNNSATVQNDDDLFWTVAVSEVWHWRLALRISEVAGGSSPNFDFIFSVPTGGVLLGWYIGNVPANSGAGMVSLDLDGTEEFIDVDSAGGVRYWVLEGFYLGGANAGTVQLQWAQNFAVAENTTLHRESMLIATRLS